MSQKTFEVITNQILRKLEEGVVPWHRPWSSPASVPRNLLSKREYRGINFFILSAAGYASPYWLTYRQAKDRGGHIKKGEKGTPVVFWKWLNIKELDDEGESEVSEKTIPLVRYYTVFNLAQCEGIEAPKIETPTFEWDPIEKCESVVRNMKNPPVISYGHNKACYVPSLDTIRMPNRELFEKPEELYSTIFHEMVHSAGHPARLGRPSIIDIQPFGTTNYSKEELIAEMGAAFLCAHTGIENKTIDNSAAYIGNWLTKLKNDSRLLIVAAASAQKSCDLILGKTESESEESEE